MSNWTNDRRKAWDALCTTPLMQEALAELALRCRVEPLPLAAGYDALVLAAAEHHRKVGQAEVLKHIEEMRKDRTPHKPLPEPWSVEARAEKDPKET